MEAKATVKHIRIAPRKARRVVDLIRGQHVEEARRILRFSTLGASEPLEKIVLGKGQLLLTTIRSHNQFNTTIYGLNDRYRGITNERRVIFMNENDMLLLDLAARDVVDIFNYDGGIERVARKFIVIPYPIPETCTATYFPETNVLVPISNTAEKSNTPVSKLVIVQIKKHAGTT